MKELKSVKIKGLEHAEWNPRSEAELQPEHPEIIKLAASIRENGLIEPIGVWEGLVIYGNRRLEAAKLAGMKDIDAVVYTGIDEATAQILTREENENRFGIDPLRDAELLKNAVSRGKTQSEIAAGCGVSEATICRRMKLTELTDEMIETLKGRDVDTKALEEIASWPEAVQEKAVKRVQDTLRYYNGHVHVKQMREVFSGLTNEIDDNLWIFDGPGGEARRNKCRSCALCTGNQPELFASEDGCEECRCMDRACFARMEAEAKRDRIVEKIGDVEYTLVKSIWDEPFHSLGARKSKKNNHAYVFFPDWMHDVDAVHYGPDPSVWKAESEKRREEERQAKEAVRKLKEDSHALLKSVEKKVVSFITNCDDDVTADNIVDSLYAALANYAAAHKDDANALLKLILVDFGFCIYKNADADIARRFIDENAADCAADLFAEMFCDALGGSVYAGGGWRYDLKEKVLLFFVKNIQQIRMAVTENEMSELILASEREDD